MRAAPTVMLVESARGARAQTGAVAPGNETIVGGRAQSYRRHPRAYGLSVNPDRGSLSASRQSLPVPSCRHGEKPSRLVQSSCTSLRSPGSREASWPPRLWRLLFRQRGGVNVL